MNRRVAAGKAVADAVRRNRPLRAFLLALAKSVSGAGGSAFLAGGWLRDAAAGKPGADIDVMVAGMPHEEIGAALNALPPAPLGIRKVVGAGKHFPVYRVATRWMDRYIDVAAARGGEDTRVRDAFGGALSDAVRRDFTVNSLLYELLPEGNRLRGELIDAFGGLADLAERTIRCVGSPEERFREDPVRTLRAIRMKNEWRGYRIDPATWEAVRRLGPALLPGVPADRFAGELVRSLEGNPAGTLDDLRDSGILRALLPELARSRSRVDRARARYALLARSRRAPATPTVLLANLLLDLAPAAGDAAARRLRFPNVRRVVSTASGVRALLAPRAPRRPLSRTEEILARQDPAGPFIALYRAAAASAGARPRDLERFLARCARTPRFVDGIDLRRAGVPEGPRREEMLAAVREASLAGRVRTREAALRMVRGR